MAGVGSPAQSQMSIFLEYPFRENQLSSPCKNMTETVTGDVASPNWFNWRPFFAFARKVYLRIIPFVTVLGQDRKLIEKHSYLIHSWLRERPRANYSFA